MKNKCLVCGLITDNKMFCSLKCHHRNRVKKYGIWNKGMKKEELINHYPNGWNTPIMKGEKNPRWKEKVSLICNFCEKQYKKDKSVSIYSKFCSKKCKLKYYSVEHKDKGNPNYKNGISLYRKNIKDFCEMCNNQTPLLIVHHNDKNRKNNKLSNLMTLCRKCHQNIHIKK